MHPMIAAMMALAAQQGPYGAAHEHTAGYDQITGAGIPVYAAGYYAPYAAGYAADQITGAQYAAGAAVPVYAAGAAMAPYFQHLAMQAAARGHGAPPTVAYGHNLGIESSHPSQPRMLPLGFASTGTVAASAVQSVVSRPQALFRGERLLIPSTVATNFQINDLRVGMVSMMVQATALPASAFQETAQETRMTWDTADRGIDVTIVVQNTDAAAAHAFSALLWGATIIR